MTREHPAARRENETVVIQPWDRGWPSAYAREAREIRRVIGPWITGGIHHVGSTAVPGLAAKPVIDIAVGVESLDSARPCIERLAEIEYLHSPYRADVMHWFCKPDPGRRTHHLHLNPHGIGPARGRDRVPRLPARTSRAAEYEMLKRGLAVDHTDDREAYTSAKAAYVARVTALARTWARAG